MEHPRRAARGHSTGAEQSASLASDRHEIAELARPEQRQTGCRLVEWKPWPFDNPSLIGHCTVAFAGGWVVSAIPVFRSRDGISVGVPNAAQLDSEGRVKLKPDGKRDYRAIVSFETTDGRERWQRAVLGALGAAGIGGAP